MRLVRDKRDLVNSIVAKARYFEERGQFNEALDQWQILKSIHETAARAGVRDSAARSKRRDQQAPRELQGALGGADRQVPGRRRLRARHADGGERAGRVSRRAGVAGAGKAGPQEPGARHAGARTCWSTPARPAKPGAMRQSLELLHEARDLDPRNTVIRTVLVNTLLVHARNWWIPIGTRPMPRCRRCCNLEPNHMPAKSLASQIADASGKISSPGAWRRRAGCRPMAISPAPWRWLPKGWLLIRMSHACRSCKLCCNVRKPNGARPPPRSRVANSRNSLHPPRRPPLRPPRLRQSFHHQRFSRPARCSRASRLPPYRSSLAIRPLPAPQPHLLGRHPAHLGRHTGHRKGPALRCRLRDCNCPAARAWIIAKLF